MSWIEERWIRWVFSIYQHFYNKSMDEFITPEYRLFLDREHGVDEAADAIIDCIILNQRTMLAGELRQWVGKRTRLPPKIVEAAFMKLWEENRINTFSCVHLINEPDERERRRFRRERENEWKNQSPYATTP